MDDLVSVMMPARNAGRFIADAIESMIRQTYSKWELIIIDDKSVDNTREIAESYSRKDPRIKVYEGNGIGVANARNKVIELATGKYIMLLDADDVSAPQRTSKLVAAAGRHENVVVGSNVLYTDLQLRIKGKSNKPVDDKNIRAGFKRKFNRMTITPGSALFNAGLLKKYRYNEFYRILSDWDLILRISENPDVVFINVAEPLYLYRINEGSMSLDQKQRIKYNLMLRFNEINRHNNKPEICSLETFESVISSKLKYRIAYVVFLYLKKIQHIMIFRKIKNVPHKIKST
jgi:glycosyltransferase involved in cell wall biosynthesis